MIICFVINGVNTCIEIPFLLAKWWPWDEERWPWGEPYPAQQIENGVDPRVSRDMTTLAIINKLSKQLSPGLQDSVSGGVKAAAEQLALPKGITVSF